MVDVILTGGVGVLAGEVRWGQRGFGEGGFGEGGLFEFVGHGFVALAGKVRLVGVKQMAVLAMFVVFESLSQVFKTS